MKKPPQKVAYLSRNSVVSEIFLLLPYNCPTAQMAESMFPNVAYRATVYRTGGFTEISSTFLPGINLIKSLNTNAANWYFLKGMVI